MCVIHLWFEAGVPCSAGFGSLVGIDRFWSPAGDLSSDEEGQGVGGTVPRMPVRLGVFVLRASGARRGVSPPPPSGSHSNWIIDMDPQLTKRVAAACPNKSPRVYPDTCVPPPISHPTGLRSMTEFLTFEPARWPTERCESGGPPQSYYSHTRLQIVIVRTSCVERPLERRVCCASEPNRMPPRIYLKDGALYIASI